MNDLDQESKKFIEWTLEQLKGRENFLFNQVAPSLAHAARFYVDISLPEFRKWAKLKMIAGAREHGAPKKDILDIEYELENEYLDMVLWFLMRKWRLMQQEMSK